MFVSLFLFLGSCICKQFNIFALYGYVNVLHHQDNEKLLEGENQNTILFL